jgi:hypothetical protein
MVPPPQPTIAGAADATRHAAKARRMGDEEFGIAGMLAAPSRAGSIDAAAPTARLAFILPYGKELETGW